MGKSQFLLLNPNGVRAQLEAVSMIGIQKVRISIRARRFNSLHRKAGYMTDALFSSKKTLDAHGWSIHDTEGKEKTSKFKILILSYVELRLKIAHLKTLT